LFLRGGKPLHHLILVERIVEKRSITDPQIQELYRLTERETEVLRLVCEGATNKEITEQGRVGVFQKIGLHWPPISRALTCCIKKTERTLTIGFGSKIPSQKDIHFPQFHEFLKSLRRG